MVRPRRPPVFHNFSFLFIYTIRYIFVFMCCSPTDLRFASATIGHRDSSILAAASAACRHIFFVYPFPHIFMTFPPLIFTNFHQVFHPVWTSAFAANETNHDLIVSARSLQLPWLYSLYSTYIVYACVCVCACVCALRCICGMERQLCALWHVGEVHKKTKTKIKTSTKYKNKTIFICGMRRRT